MNLLYTLALTSVYIFNSRGQYLSVGEDGKPVLSKKPVAMEVTDATETPDKNAGRKNFNSTNIKWILKSSADGTYTLGYQDSDAYSTAFVYTEWHNCHFVRGACCVIHFWSVVGFYASS